MENHLIAFQLCHGSAWSSLYFVFLLQVSVNTHSGPATPLEGDKGLLV